MQDVMNIYNQKLQISSRYRRNFDNLLKLADFLLLASMYDSERVGKEFFPEGSKREDHVMWLNLLKKSLTENP